MCATAIKHLRNVYFPIFLQVLHVANSVMENMYRGADKSLARPGRKQAAVTKL